MRRILTALVSGAALMAASATASAAPTYSFGGVTPNDGSFLTSSLVGANNQNIPSSGIFVETFDGPRGCQLNSEAFGVSTTGNFWLAQGLHAGHAAPPANDTTCYASAPDVLGGDNSTTIDFTVALDNLFPGKKIDYLGLYWGSIDTYNTISFYAGDELLLTINGADALAAANGTSGDQFGPGSNLYVNLNFSADEQFTKMVFTSSSYAMEIDNVVIHVGGVAIPEPATVGLLGAGLLGLGLARRRKAAK